MDAAPTSDQAGRFDVRSADGTSLAVWVEGSGPALVMVHGSIADHRGLRSVADARRLGGR
jgi:hypothetical protein